MKNPSSRVLRNLLAVAALTAAAALAQAADRTATAPQQDFVSLIAKADLTQQGITSPTDAQLSQATDDVAALRASGMGWGAIANSLGLRLGAVVSAANRARQAQEPASAARQSHAVAARSGDTPGASRGGSAGGSGGQGGGGGNGGKGGGGGGGKR